ncbi:MAG: hypothetical protein JW885_02755 [Deltaproteobacteria bacterium]|nr:hypothetical protein [Candidatus Zymogenaceae bacterium]
MLKNLVGSILRTLAGLAVLGLVTAWLPGWTFIDYLVAAVAVCAAGAADFYLDREPRDVITLYYAVKRAVTVVVFGGFILGFLYALMAHAGWSLWCYFMILIAVACVGAVDFFLWWLPEKYGGDE